MGAAQLITNFSARKWAAASALRATSQPMTSSAGSYLRVTPFFLHFLPFMCFPAAATSSSSLHIASYCSPLLRTSAPSFSLCMQVKRLMTKNSAKRGTAVGWPASAITKGDLNKAKKAGFLSESMEYAFPGDEVIPRPTKGFRVMFLSFLLRGLSLPAHEFLRGLHFVYGVQVHQLTPNSILHVVCFITLCEAFLGLDPH
jgi:hypothetical protein